MSNSNFHPKRRVDETVPLPNKRTILGGPLNAQKRRVIRPFSRTCETVSIPVSGDQHLCVEDLS